MIMKKLPKYFVIRRQEDNPLWVKYVDWLTHMYGIRPIETDNFCGYDGNRETGVASGGFLSSFENNPKEITLEVWHAITDWQSAQLIPDNLHKIISGSSITETTLGVDCMFCDETIPCYHSQTVVINICDKCKSTLKKIIKSTPQD